MLPGFRFLFAAILLSTSILVFGLGAAALLRATHEQYVSNPSWRNGPQEKVFAQVSEPAQPVLAALRAEPEAAAEPTPSLRDRVPTIGLPANEPEQVAALTTEPDVLLHWATRIGGRYMGADRAEEYGRRNAAPPEMVVRVTPTKVVAKVDIAD